jgi:hypothetical protein
MVENAILYHSYLESWYPAWPGDIPQPPHVDDSTGWDLWWKVQGRPPREKISAATLATVRGFIEKDMEMLHCNLWGVESKFDGTLDQTLSAYKEILSRISYLEKTDLVESQI